MAVYNEVKDFLKRIPNHPETQRRAGNVQTFIPGLHSWPDSDYRKYGHQMEPTFFNRMGLVFTTGESYLISNLILTDSFSFHNGTGSVNNDVAVYEC